jgi:predicted transport protein
MALVDIDKKLKKRVEAEVERDRVAYPSIKNFVDKAIQAQLYRILTTRERVGKSKST